MKNRPLSEWLIDIIPSLFILLFVYTAITKIYEHNLFEVVLSKSPLIGGLAIPISYLLPAIEFFTAIILFIPWTRFAGLWISFLLMSIFTLYIAYMIAYTPHLPCSCGGVLKQLTWREHLIFNICFTILALVGIILHVTNTSRKDKRIAIAGYKK